MEVSRASITRPGVEVGTMRRRVRGGRRKGKEKEKEKEKEDRTGGLH